MEVRLRDKAPLVLEAGTSTVLGRLGNTPNERDVNNWYKDGSCKISRRHLKLTVSPDGKTMTLLVLGQSVQVKENANAEQITLTRHNSKVVQPGAQIWMRKGSKAPLLILSRSSSAESPRKPSRKRKLGASGAEKAVFFNGISIWLVQRGLSLAQAKLFQEKVENHGGSMVLHGSAGEAPRVSLGKLLQQEGDSSQSPASKASSQSLAESPQPASFEGCMYVVADEKLTRDELLQELRPWLPASGPLASSSSSQSEGHDLDIVGRPVLGGRWISSCLAERRLLPISNYLFQGSTPPVAAAQDPSAQELKLPAIPPYACQRRAPLNPVNKDLTDQLDMAAKVYNVRGDAGRSTSFMKASSILKSITTKLEDNERSYELLECICEVKGIGPSIKEDLKEMISTGSCSRLNGLMEEEHVNQLLSLTSIHGVGKSTAEAWIHDNVTTVEEAQKRWQEGTLKGVTETQSIGLEYYDDILQPLTRADIEDIAGKFISEAERAWQKLQPGGKENST
ncbi:unnamed protein product [Chrysoparadoxa australica]